MLLTALIKSVKKISNQKRKLPNSISDRTTAYVRDIKKGYALLNVQGKEIISKMDAPVKKGEYLLLQFKGFSGQKHFYKVLKRSSEPFEFKNGSNVMQLRLLLENNGKGMPVPLVVRYPLARDQDEHQSQNETKDAYQLLLELIVETQNFGFIVLRIERKNCLLYAKFLLDFEDAGLGANLDKLKQIFYLLSGELNIKFQEVSWVHMSIREREKVINWYKNSVTIDKRV